MPTGGAHPTTRICIETLLIANDGRVTGRITFSYPHMEHSGLQHFWIEDWITIAYAMRKLTHVSVETPGWEMVEQWTQERIEKF